MDDVIPPPHSSAPLRARAEPRVRRNLRPRDSLGRPLPYGSTGVAAQPPMPSYDPGAALAEAQRLLDAGMPFHAHEVLEDTWKLAPVRERQIWQGLAQLAVGITHSLRGNRSGAEALIRRGAARIAAYHGDGHGIEIGALLRWADRASLALAASDGAVPIGVPRLVAPGAI